MKTIKYPKQLEWKQLAQRPTSANGDVKDTAQQIISAVQQRGDSALKEYTQKFDGVQLDKLSVSLNEIENAEKQISAKLQAAIQLANDNITAFHKSQLQEEPVTETTEGVQCWRKSVPIEKVGLYVPGGSAPLFSTVLMLGIPAKLANCQDIILCTPPQEDGKIHPAVRYTADLIGIKQIYKVGGAQAIAAMTYGTETIPRVNKIFGPGNQYVTQAKELVQQEGVAIDMPAGPSEVLVIADKSSHPTFVAADLLSQAEHGPDSQVMLVSDNEELVNEVGTEIEQQVDRLPRKSIARQALNNSSAVVLESLEKCMEFSNCYAPEHLIIATDNGNKLAHNVTSAGSVFIGHYSCESAGDYASGTNHTLPTNSWAKSYSGVSVESFMKKITFQQLSAKGLRKIGPSIEQMAEAEGLRGHKNAVTLRMNEIEKKMKR